MVSLVNGGSSVGSGGGDGGGRSSSDGWTEGSNSYGTCSEGDEGSGS